MTGCSSGHIYNISLSLSISMYLSISIDMFVGGGKIIISKRSRIVV